MRLLCIAWWCHASARKEGVAPLGEDSSVEKIRKDGCTFFVSKAHVSLCEPRARYGSLRAPSATSHQAKQVERIKNPPNKTERSTRSRKQHAIPNCPELTCKCQATRKFKQETARTQPRQGEACVCAYGGKAGRGRVALQRRIPLEANAVVGNIFERVRKYSCTDSVEYFLTR